jgi:hypothetical protein
LSYDPGVSGAISFITAQYDRAITSNMPINVPFNFRLVIEQGGVDYATAKILGFGDTGGGVYHTLGPTNLVSNDFSQIDFATDTVTASSHPNFSAGSILFGIGVSSTTAGGQIITADYDNLDITINQTPLPAALPLFATGIGGLGLLGWRRKRKAQAVA